MANARKCDRCGTCFDPLNTEGMMCRFVNPIFQDSYSLKESVVSARLLPSAAPDAYVDLCPTCSELFENFMCGADISEAYDDLYEEMTVLRAGHDAALERVDILRRERDEAYEDLEVARKERDDARSELAAVTDELNAASDEVRKLQNEIYWYKLHRDQTNTYITNRTKVNKEKKNEQEG